MATNFVRASHGEIEDNYRVALTLRIADPAALWDTAAERLLAASGCDAEEVAEVIGPREDPSVAECIAVLAAPMAVAGCEAVAFGVDELRGHPLPVNDVGNVVTVAHTA